MISQTAEYALRVVVFLAAAEGKAVITRDIAAGTQIPVDYLAKVLQQLGRAGIVGSQRGLHGGFVLARDAGALTVYDVVQIVDPIRRITACPLNLRSHRAGLCPLHRRLDEALELVERAFRDSSIVEMLKDRASNTPLCETSVSSNPRTVSLRVRPRRARTRKVGN
jgi:Rrf2 family transcriptional regulator, nitric oxide-sensitive transcriptional repressor